jgi:hypothetical protein
MSNTMDRTLFQKMYACELLYILAICLTKLSILAFYLRAFGQMIRLPIIAIAGVVICGGITIVGSDFQGVIPIFEYALTG